MRTALSLTTIFLLLLVAAPVSEAATVCVGPADEACVSASPDASAGVKVLGFEADVSCPVGGTLCTLTVDDEETPLGLQSEEHSGFGCESTTYRTAQTSGELFSTAQCGAAFCARAVLFACAPLSASTEGTAVCHDTATWWYSGDRTEYVSARTCRGVAEGDNGLPCTAHYWSYPYNTYWYYECVDTSTPTRPCHHRYYEFGGSTSRAYDTCAGIEPRAEQCSGNDGTGIYAVVTDYDNDPNVQQRLACIAE